MSVEVSPQREHPAARAWRAIETLVPWGRIFRRESPSVKAITTFGSLPSLARDVEPSEESLQLLRADLSQLISRLNAQIDSTQVMGMIVSDVYTTYATGELNEEGEIGDIAIFNPHVHFVKGRPETARRYSDVLPEVGAPFTRTHFDGGRTEMTSTWDKAMGGFYGRFRDIQGDLRVSCFYAPAEQEARKFLETVQNPSVATRATTVKGRLQNLGLQYSRF